MQERIRGLHHVGLPTDCMDETIAFYQSFGAKIIFEKMDEDGGRPIRVTLLDFAGLVVECYERTETPKNTGAIEHLAFRVEGVEELYRICKEKGYEMMADCAESIGISTYWPKNARWFIVYGPNREKIEFCQE